MKINLIYIKFCCVIFIQLIVGDVAGYYYITLNINQNFCSFLLHIYHTVCLLCCTNNVCRLFFGQMFNFWVDFFSEAITTEISESLRFPVGYSTTFVVDVIWCFRLVMNFVYPAQRSFQPDFARLCMLIIIIIYVKNCSVYRNTVRVTLSLEI